MDSQIDDRAIDNWLLAVDAGGSGTRAMVGQVVAADDVSGAVLEQLGDPPILWEIGRPTPGRVRFRCLTCGHAGPGNPQVVGFQESARQIRQAAGEALAAVGNPTVEAACLSVAGCGRGDDRRRLMAAVADLGRRVHLVHDAAALLAAAFDQGVALIAGTGSLAWGRWADTGVQQREARCGGWGYLFGDEGSGFGLGQAWLRLAAEEADGRRPRRHLDGVLSHFQLEKPDELVGCIYHDLPNARTRIASLGQIVVELAESGDENALSLVGQSARDLVELVEGVVQQLKLPADNLPLAVGGSLLTESLLLRRQLCQQLQQRGLAPSRLAVVAQPLMGGLYLSHAACLSS